MKAGPKRGKKDEGKLAGVRELIHAESTLVLSVRDAEGAVHAAPLFYLDEEELSLVWLSSRDSRHSVYLAAEPRVAVTIYRSTFQWKQIVGVQMEGQAEEVAAAERAALVEAYCARFHIDTVLSFALIRSTAYRFRPRWIRSIDNRVRFGYRQEIEL